MKQYNVELKTHEDWDFIKRISAPSAKEACRQFEYLLQCVGARKLRAHVVKDDVSDCACCYEAYMKLNHQTERA